MKKLILLVSFFVITSSVHSRVGCFLRTRHVDSPELDSKQHRVYQQCSCPCEPTYPRLPQGRCRQCNHYLDESPPIVIERHELPATVHDTHTGLSSYSFFGQER